jgi:hypothetical protein
VSYFAEDIHDGTIVPHAKPVSVTPREPEASPVVVEVPPTQIRIIQDRLAKRSRA